MASEHTAKAFDSDLQELTRLVAEMGGLAERMITESVDALARRETMVNSLREIVGAVRLATDLERIGDLAKNMGKRVSALENDFHPLKLIRGLEHMTDQVGRSAEHTS